jgi:hypothetical protein
MVVSVSRNRLCVIAVAILLSVCGFRYVACFFWLSSSASNKSVCTVVVFIRFSAVFRSGDVR